MRPRSNYLNGRVVVASVFIAMAIVTITVYLSGIHLNRPFTTNFYISLAIIATMLLVFLTYGLYKGVSFYNTKLDISKADLNLSPGSVPDVGIEGASFGDDVFGVIAGILLWIAIGILAIVLLILLEGILWFLLAVVISMLYWIIIMDFCYCYSCRYHKIKKATSR